MYSILLLMLLSSGEATNSHKPIPLLQRVDEPPVITTMVTWEVAVVGSKHVIKAAKFVEQSGLLLFTDEDDEIVLAINKSQFLYARRYKLGEKP